MNQLSPLSLAHDSCRDSAWERAADYVKQERQMRSVKKIVVKGAVDVVFFRAPTAHLVVAGMTQDTINSITTTFVGDKLVIEQAGVSINTAGGNISVSGSGNIVAGGSIHIGGRRGGVNMQFNGSVGSVVIGQGRGIVGIALPEAPRVRIKGSGDVTLYDLKQAELRLEIKGSGDITAFGQVGHLDADIAGSGDVDTSKLLATSAQLSVAGSGDIDAFVTQSVEAHVAGSGNIAVHGNPPVRSHSVAGSGDVKFKKR